MENQTTEKKYETVKISQEPFIETDKTVHLSNYIAEDEDLEITIPFPTIEALIAFNDAIGYDALEHLEYIFKTIGKRKGFLDFTDDVVSYLEGVIDDHDILYQSKFWSEVVEDYKKYLIERLELTKENCYENEEFEKELEGFENFSSEKPFLNGVSGYFDFGKDIVIINDYRLDLEDIIPRIGDAKFISIEGLIFSQDFIYYHSKEFVRATSNWLHNMGYEQVQPLLEEKFRKWHPTYSISFEKHSKNEKFEHFILIDGKTISLIEE